MVSGRLLPPGDRLVGVLRADQTLRDIQWHRFGYESPKLPRLWAPKRIPDFDDIAQSLEPFLAAYCPTGEVAVVTHSQGGLILQRYLAWMLNEGNGRKLARIRSIVMLACPHEGSDYLRSLRTAAGFGFHPQARALRQLDTSVAASRRTVLGQIVHANEVDDRNCPIPIHVYAGTTDNVVTRVTAHSAFPGAGMIPGNHFSIIDPRSPDSLTVQTIRRHLLEDLPIASAGAEKVALDTMRQQTSRHLAALNQGPGPGAGRDNGVGPPVTEAHARRLPDQQPIAAEPSVKGASHGWMRTRSERRRRKWLTAFAVGLIALVLTPASLVAVRHLNQPDPERSCYGNGDLAVWVGPDNDLVLGVGNQFTISVKNVSSSQCRQSMSRESVKLIARDETGQLAWEAGHCAGQWKAKSELLAPKAQRPTSVSIFRNDCGGPVREGVYYLTATVDGASSPPTKVTIGRPAR